MNKKQEKKYTPKELQKLIPEFIEREYAKGEDTEFKKRGLATVAITLFTIWLEKSGK